MKPRPRLITPSLWLDLQAHALSSSALHLRILLEVVARHEPPPGVSLRKLDGYGWALLPNGAPLGDLALANLSRLPVGETADALGDLLDVGLLELVEVDGQRFLALPGWAERQALRPNHPGRSTASRKRSEAA